MKKLEQRSNCVFNGGYVAENLELLAMTTKLLVGYDYKATCYYCKKTFSKDDLYMKLGSLKVCRICIEKHIVVALQNLSLLKSYLNKKLAWLRKNKEKLNNEELINAL